MFQELYVSVKDRKFSICYPFLIQRQDLKQRLPSFMSVNQRLFYNNCTMMWKIIHDRAPSHLSSNFTLQSDRAACHDTRRTRSMAKLDVYHGMPHARSFRRSGMDASNGQPFYLQSICSLTHLTFVRDNVSPMLR